MISRRTTTFPNALFLVERRLQVASVVNHDTEIENLLKVVFIPDYNVSKAEVITPASDLSNHISTAGTEASGTSNMNFAFNGRLIIDVEITREIGEEHIFLFGNLEESVDELRHKHIYEDVKACKEVFSAIESGLFGH